LRLHRFAAPGGPIIGGLLGVAAGAAFTGLTYFGLLAIPNRYIFSVTSWLIALLAAGMAAQSVQFLDNAGVVVALDRTVWDTSWLLSEASLFGKLLHTLVGYTERPTEMQLMTYIATLFAMFLLMRLARPAPRQRVAASHSGAYLHPPKRDLRVAYSVGHMCETFPPNKREVCLVTRASIKVGSENRLQNTR
jgi:high-affinity Fe2+/Pb2+ permease